MQPSYFLEVEAGLVQDYRIVDVAPTWVEREFERERDRDMNMNMISNHTEKHSKWNQRNSFGADDELAEAASDNCKDNECMEWPSYPVNPQIHDQFTASA